MTGSPYNNSAASPALRPSVATGVLLAVGIGAAGYWIGIRYPQLGGPMAGLLLGMLLRQIRVPEAHFMPGLMFSQKTLLQAAIVLAGAGLTVGEIMSAGIAAMPLILVTVAAGLLLIPLAGRLLHVKGKVTHLVAAGTAICGATAIGAVAPVLGATAAEVAYAISTIFLFNLLAVAVYPIIAHMAGFSDWMFGLWSGAAVHDTSSVLAAAYAFSDTAGKYGTVVKLSRTTLLIPVIVGYGLMSSDRQRVSWRTVIKNLPSFIAWFGVAAALNSVGLIPSVLGAPLKWLSKFLMVVALAAVGLNTDFGTVKRIGPRPMLLGLGASVLIGGLSWVLIRLFYA